MLPLKFKSLDCLLQAYFFPAAADPVRATVIFLQGFPGVEGDELICEKLAQAGINTLTFNYRGVFQSEGAFSFLNVIGDAGAALRFVKESKDLETYQIDLQRIILGGWSFGGAMVPAVAVHHPEFTRFFMISGRNFGKEARKIESDPAYAEQVAKNLEGLRAPDGPLNFGGGLISGLIENQDVFDYEKLAPELKDRDILLIGGWDDDLTSLEEHTIPFYRSLRGSGAEKVRIEAVRDGHDFANSKDQLVQLILDWLH